MQHDKRIKEQSKRTRALPSVSQPQLQQVKEQLDHPGSHLIYTDNNVTGASWDPVTSIPLVGTQAYWSKGLLTKKQTETHDGICLDQSSSKKQIKHREHLTERVAQQINVKTTTQADDETLLNVIESADLDQAFQLLKRNNHFSQDGLDRALISACRHGLKFLVQTLFHLGANVQYKDCLGNTPLLICAESGFVDIVRFLLKKKAEVNVFNSAGDTALILSIRPAGALDMVRVLLDQNEIDFSHQNRDGYTALMKAVEVKDVDVIKILMDSHTKKKNDWTTSRQVCKPCCPESIEVINSKGMTAEEIADKCGLVKIYKIIKSHIKVGLSMLVIAIEENDTESLNILLDSHLIEKQDIQVAFEKVFQQCDLKKGKIDIDKGIVIIKKLLENGANVNTSWHSKSSPLSIAVKMGDSNLVELLCWHIDHQGGLWPRDVTQALIEAAKLGRCDLINPFLKYKACINHYCYSGSPLDSALSNGHLEDAKLLVQHGASMVIESALQSAVTQQLPEYVNFVFENYQLEVTSYAANNAYYFNNVLVSACKGGNLEIIGRLLDAGADVNHEMIGETPLGVSKNGDVARFLIKRGANLQLKFGNTVLITILKPILNNKNTKDSSTLEVVKVLLENGASVNESGYVDRTLLMVAASNENNVAMLQILLDHGADINNQDSKGNTVLMEAVRGRCPLNVLFLLKFHKEENLCIDVQNHEGKTALMFAVTYFNPKIAKQLIDFGADVNIKKLNGNTPLLHALTRRHEPREILTTLINARSDVNCQNKKGFSPLMLASRCCWINAITTLLNSGADVNAVSEKNSAKTALSFLSGIAAFNVALSLFLKNGACTSYMKPKLFHQMIHDDKIDSIPELIRCGIWPKEVKSVNVFLFDIDDSEEIPVVSPLCVSLLVGNVSLACYFVRNLFLTNSDVTSLTGNMNLHRCLERKQHQECLNFLDKLSSQPFSLFQLAFVTVSSAVGSSPGRENRVNKLPLPQATKDKLLFKTQEIQLNIATKDIDYLKRFHGISTVNQFNVASAVWDDNSNTEYIFYDYDSDTD